MKRLGIIGAGNMGGAILSGILTHHCLSAEDVIISDANQAALDGFAQQYPGLSTTVHNLALAQQSEMVLLAVKPQFLKDVLTQIKDALLGKAVVSIAAGWTLEMLQRELGSSLRVRLLRVMPNTPALVGAGMTAFAKEHTLAPGEFAFIQSVFEAIGRVAIVPERLFDGVIAVSGSSPAYFYMMLEAMGDAAVREGLPRSLAYEMAAQAMLGSAKMVLETGKHPGQLKDAVCSPGGTTIDAVAALEQIGFRGSVMQAMDACAKKSKDMAK